MELVEKQVAVRRASIRLKDAVCELRQYVIENKLDCNVLLKCDQVAVSSNEITSIIEETRTTSGSSAGGAMVGFVVVVAPWVIGVYQIVQFIKG